MKNSESRARYLHNFSARSIDVSIESINVPALLAAGYLQQPPQLLSQGVRFLALDGEKLQSTLLCCLKPYL